MSGKILRSIRAAYFLLSLGTTASAYLISTFAGQTSVGSGGDGGPATSAFMSGAYGLSLDTNTNIMYIADLNNNKIRKVSAGIMNTFVGTGTAGTSGNGGPAINAQIGRPVSARADSAGNVYIT